ENSFFEGDLAFPGNSAIRPLVWQFLFEIVLLCFCLNVTKSKAAERITQAEKKPKGIAINDDSTKYLEFEANYGHYLAKRNKTAEKAKKRRPEDRQMNLVSHRKALTSPKVPVC
ncbi:hypothetical protein H5410_027705, partial [Solanum commersonii]